ncbi:MAG: tetratricopeptide repeat protein [Gemmatimonadota bacterium]|nr:tetratricopeptide repeat protein [Gemmatimonadota bacterium]
MMRNNIAVLPVGVVLALALVPGLRAQESRKQVEEGNRLYGEGRFGEAHERYVEALRRDPDNYLIRFNEGNALYQSQEYQRALEAYGAVTEAGVQDLDASAWYNLGNTLVQQQQLPEALEAYKQALRRNPTDRDAKHNLEVVLERMQQDQQDQPQDQDQRDEDQEQEDNPDQGSPDPNQEGSPQDGENDPQDGDQGGNQPPDPGDQDGQGEPDEGEGEGSQGGEQPLPPGQMSREEAERLLQALEEDPGEVDRQAGEPRGRRPRRDWE